MEYRLRELERAWKASGSKEDEVAYRHALGHADHFPIRYVVEELRVAVPIHQCHRCGLEAPVSLSSLDRIGNNLIPRSTHTDNPPQLIPDNVHALVGDWSGVPEGWMRLERRVAQFGTAPYGRYGSSGRPSMLWVGEAGKHTYKLCVACAEEVNGAIDKVMADLKPRPEG